MTVSIIKGNIFTTKAQTIVNTVNCVGVMGAGIALECRLRYPELFAKYQEHCKDGALSPGKLWLYKADDRWILNFPTKKDWKAPSKMEYLHAGLEKFVATYERIGITSIAFPLLGADRGGIPKANSEAVICQYLGPIDLPVELYHYDPAASDDLFEEFSSWLASGGNVLLRDRYKIRAEILGRISNAMGSGSVRQLNQLGRIKGIGIKTLEKVFQAARSEILSDQSQSSLRY